MGQRQAADFCCAHVGMHQLLFPAPPTYQGVVTRLAEEVDVTFGNMKFLLHYTKYDIYTHAYTLN